METLPTLLPSVDGSFTLVDPRTGATYHSLNGAREESLCVYINGSGLPHKLAQTPVVRVLEIGFGTGLNFILTVEEANSQPNSQLEYTAFEPYPLGLDVLQAFHEPLGAANEWMPVISQLPAIDVRNNVRYNLLDNAFSPKTQLGAVFDIIYYDPFGPQRAPEMWAVPTLEAVFRHLAPGGTLVTFSVTGNFKRFLQTRGIPYHRPPGFGKKRHRMVAGPMPG